MTHALNAWLSGISFGLALTSPLRRARDTCDLARLGINAEVTQHLCEWDYSEYEGRSSTDIRRQAPDWNVFRNGCPGGATPAQVAQRADRLIAGLLAVRGNIALFSHGQFGCALAVRWIGLAIVAGQHFALDAGSVSILGPKREHPDVPGIRQWNGGPSARPDGP